MKLRSFCLAGVVAFLASPASAHHSFAIFDQTKVLYLEGTVKELEWINPHTWLHVTFANPAGVVSTWSFEAGATAQLASLGWKPDTVTIGDKVRVGYRPMKDGSRGG